MDSGNAHIIQPRWDGTPGISNYASSFSSLHEVTEAAVAGVGILAEQSFNAPEDELVSAGQRLAESLKRLQLAVEGFESARKKPQEGGFEESKLLASIEKWQRRYYELEEEAATLGREHEHLKRQHEEQQADLLHLKEVTGLVAARLDHTIEVLDDLLQEEAAEEQDWDEEDPDYN